MEVRLARAPLLCGLLLLLAAGGCGVLLLLLLLLGQGSCWLCRMRFRAGDSTEPGCSWGC